MLAKVNRIHIDENKRIIVISDIHGDIDSLRQLLQKAEFRPDDVLILNGDMVEKGDKSLETLHYIMELSNTHSVIPICGNCDAISRAVYSAERNREFLAYLLFRKSTLVNDMCRKLSITLTEESDMMEVKARILESFAKELEWILALPDIVETKNFIFAHAGISAEYLDRQKTSYVRSTKAFYEQGLSFNKYCVVGHWPVSLYNRSMPMANPIIDYERKIISIDGGNVLKADGQLNALIIPGMNSDKFDYISYDKLQKAVALDDQEESEDPYHILWTDNQIKLLKKDDEFSYCEQVSTQKRMWILNKYIYEDIYGFRCEGFTDYRVPVKAGETVKVVEETSKGYLVKKNGVTGWYYGNLTFEQNGSEDKYD